MSTAQPSITIARYEPYPYAPAPNSVVVGFSVSLLDRTIYKESLVPFGRIEGLTEMEVVALAYDDIKDAVAAWAAECDQCCIVGQPYTPPAVVPPTTDPAVVTDPVVTDPVPPTEPAP